MRERPILFSAPMVRAILSGQKTQTRRVVNGIDPDRLNETMTRAQWRLVNRERPMSFGASYFCPYGRPGDRLWVRETWQHAHHQDGPYRPGVPVHYRADYIDDPHGPDGEKSPEGRYRTWRPSIHMPRWASRITLEITGVRVERLRDISETDAQAEGVEGHYIEDGWYWRNYLLSDADAAIQPMLTGPKESFRTLWESINGTGAWDANPWVWVVEFRRLADG